MASLFAIETLILLSTILVISFLVLSRMVVVTALTPFVCLRLDVLARTLRLAWHVVPRFVRFARDESLFTPASTSLEELELS